MRRLDNVGETTSARQVILLCFVMAVYSLSGFFTKLASWQEFLSLPYCACLAGVLVVLGIYAVLWQMVLKRMQLNKAYPFRSLCVVYGLAIAGLFFHETITLFNLLGSGLVIIGLLVITTSQ